MRRRQWRRQVHTGKRPEDLRRTCSPRFSSLISRVRAHGRTPPGLAPCALVAHQLQQALELHEFFLFFELKLSEHRDHHQHGADREQCDRRQPACSSCVLGVVSSPTAIRAPPKGDLKSDGQRSTCDSERKHQARDPIKGEAGRPFERKFGNHQSSSMGAPKITALMTL